VAKQSSRKNRSPRTQKTPPASDLNSESRTMEAATVFWMLSTLATLALVVVFLGLAAFSRLADAPAAMNLAGFLLLCSVITGSLTLVLTVAVPPSRKIPPPHSVTAFAAVVGAAPWFIFLVIWATNAGAA